MESKDYLDMPAWKLDERAELLSENRYTINYGPERAKQIKTELGMIALEILCRQLENHDQDPASSIALLDIDYFGYHVDAKGLSLGKAEIGLNDTIKREG